MLVRPHIADETIIACLADRYGIAASGVEFLPLGADPWSAAFRASAPGGDVFVKLRLGNFEPVSVTVPVFLKREGIAEVLAPLAAVDGALSAPVGPSTLIAYPFVEARNAAEQPLTPSQWRVFGRALRCMHDAPLPAELTATVTKATFPPRFRDRVRELLTEPPDDGDAVDAGLAALLSEQGQRIARAVERAERLAVRLPAKRLPGVLCHTDLHAGNLLVSKDGAIRIVDWDQPLIAPRERDLMFIGGGVIGVWNTPEESAWFHEGYGPVEIDRDALAYFRLERVIEDIAVSADQILSGSMNIADRSQNLVWLKATFAPGDVLDIAEATAEA
jgi:spectinomycin phosphotransferase